MKNMKNLLKYEIVDGVDHVLAEQGNKYTALRKVSWNEKEPKMEVRTWYNDPNGDEDTPGKGATLTDEACDELTRALLEEGYGDTKEIVNAIKGRKSFMIDLKDALNDTNSSDDSSDNEEDSDDAEQETLYNPEELLG